MLTETRSGAAVAVSGPRAREPVVEAAEALRLGRIRAAHDLYAAALEKAGDAAARAAALEGLGRVAHRSGRPREAVRLLEEALATRGESVRDRPDLAGVLARAYATLGDLERSELVLTEAVRRVGDDGDRPAVVRFATLLTYALTDQGKFEEAERALAQLVEAGRGLEDPETRGRIEWAQARLRAEQGHPEVAIVHARAAFELLQQTDQRAFLALTYELLASLEIDLGRYERALDLLRDGWPLLLDTATPLQVAHYRIEEARALAGLGEREGAAALAMRVAAQLDGTLPGDAGRAYALLAELFDGLGDVPRARQLYERGIELLRQQGPSRYLADAYRRLAELLEAEYRTEDAVEVLKRAIVRRR